MQKNMTYYMNSYKIAFLASLCFISAVAIYRWFVAPHQNYLAAAERYESAVSTLAAKKQLIHNNLKVSQIKYDKLEEQYNNLQTKLFDPLGERKFFSNIEDICRQSNCKMLSLTFSQSSIEESKAEVKSQKKEYAAASSAHLEVEGKYVNIISLMNKLQEEQRLVKISSVDINPDNKNQGYLICTMNITIYVIKEKKDF